MINQAIDRVQLAKFIEYAAENKVSTSEWSRFAVNHYSDPAMEHARKECVALLGGHRTEKAGGPEVRAQLHHLAKELRNET